MAINPRPEWRVSMAWGMEEPASVVFSALSLMLVVWSLFRRRAMLAGRSGLSGAWSSWPHAASWDLLLAAYGVSGVTSIAFHWKETVLTERSDYLSASFLVCALCACAVARVLRPFKSSHRAACFWASFCPLLGVWVWHARYMVFVKFDYGWHFKLCIRVALVIAWLWLLWSVRQLLVKRGPARACAVWSLMGVLFTCLPAPLELSDFRPLWRTFDAHSLWHVAMILQMLSVFHFYRLDLLRWTSKHSKRA